MQTRAAPTAGARAFDDVHPPSRALLDDCVHCGFCLPACPTYLLWGEEMDSPRGRILLMDLAARGELVLNAQLVQHWDACLGCMACVPACPARCGGSMSWSQRSTWRRFALAHRGASPVWVSAACASPCSWDAFRAPSSPRSTPPRHASCRRSAARS